MPETAELIHAAAVFGLAMPRQAYISNLRMQRQFAVVAKMYDAE